MQNIIQKIIAFGVMAPSGENCQPWRFEVTGNTVTIYDLPERDQSLYSWGGRSSYVAHGGLIENMVIAASVLGYSSRVSLFPKADNHDLVATLSLEPKSAQENSLFPYIKERTTNRKPYREVSLTETEKSQFLSIGGSEGGRFTMIEDKKKRNKVAQAVAVNEIILLSNRHLHDFFFDHVTWSEMEDKKKSIGFYIKTLELPPPAEMMFKLFKHWPALRFLKPLGFPKIVAKENAKLYSTGSAMGLITISSNTPADYVVAGRIMQRIWLTSTKLGFDLQPLTGILFLSLRIKSGDTKNFSPSEIQIINEAYGTIVNTFALTIRETPVMLFRLGKSDPPTARATRLAPDIRFSP